MRNILLKVLFAFSGFSLFVACANENTQNSDTIFQYEMLDSSFTGIDFINFLKDDPMTTSNVLSYDHYFNGAGVAVVDINNDGLQDLFFSGNEVDNRLYLNKGNLKFEDITESANINENKVWSAGVTVVDLNNDGYKDFYVCQQGPFTDPKFRQNLLFINNGDLTFSERAKEYGLNDGNQSTQAVFLDYDKDGDLDCYVMNESKYVRVFHDIVFEDLKKKENMLAASGHFYRNDKGKFNRVTEEVGMLKYGFGLGLVVSDFNGDNWPDIYVANDYSVPDFMYINQKDGTFKESIKEHTKQISFFGMGCDAADFNNDGQVDISVVDMAAQDHFRSKTLMESMDVGMFWYYILVRKYHTQYMFNSLQLNNGDGTFENIANFSNVASSDWSWASIFSDVDLDGYKDLFIANGFRRYARDNDFRNRMKEVREQNGGAVPVSMRKELYEMMPEVKLPNKLYHNSGQLKYDDKAIEFGLEEATYSYGAAFGDLDNDGDMELIVNNIDQPAMIWKSNASEISNYFKIQLKSSNDPNLTRNSKVYLYRDDQIQMQEYSFTRGYESYMEESLLFGLGDQTNIDSIKIVWPDDNVQIVTDLLVNQLNQIEYEEGYDLNQKIVPTDPMFVELDMDKLGIKYSHKEDGYDDFVRETLLPHRQSTLGPALAKADVNNDGLTDFYIGGAKDSPGALYIQNPDGSFQLTEKQPWQIDVASEDIDALFADINGDGWQDLFVLSGGGGEFMGEDPVKLLDRFYANTGNGLFAKVGNALPANLNVSSTIETIDFDSDGDIDLFVGGGSKPGNYPASEPSYLLQNDRGLYKDVTSQFFGDTNFGIVKDIEATDINSDGKTDLIIVGEWTDIQIWINEGDSFAYKSTSFGIDSLQGWWYSILACDYDGDGDEDYVIGNMSENYKHHVSKKKPLYLFYNDFDENGVGDIVLSKSYKNELVPARGKECSTGQMPFLAEKVKTYNEFATSNIFEIYGDDKITNSIKLEVNTFKSVVLINEGTRFSFKELPLAAQLFPILDMELEDVNGDGLDDIIMVGNVYNTEVETPRVDSGNGLILINEGSGNYHPLSLTESGFKAPGNAKKLVCLNSNNGKTIIVANNNGRPQIFSNGL